MLSKTAWDVQRRMFVGRAALRGESTNGFRRACSRSGGRAVALRAELIWPGSGWEHRAEVLPMMALLFPDAMTRRVDERHRAHGERCRANEGTGHAHRRLDRRDRAARHVEEALAAAAIANGKDVQRSPAAPPQAVLQVQSR
jgi:hypothetical protein